MPQFSALRVSVDSYNTKWLSELTGSPKDFQAVDRISASTEERVLLVRTKLKGVAVPMLSVKECSRVLATRRLSPDVPTGTTGNAIAADSVGGVVCLFRRRPFHVSRTYWDVYSSYGQVIGTCSLLPLMQAWALTIHRAQGSDLASVRIDFSQDKWACDGLVYATLSRVRSFGSMCVPGLTEKNIKTNRKCLDFWTALRESAM